MQVSFYTPVSGNFSFSIEAPPEVILILNFTGSLCIGGIR